jgi:pyruvate/2-oxoglutarate dehydrogenase complex dihydrolipoamide dehydrogenase (E3) component
VVSPFVEYDLIVIGGGVGGIGAARAAARRGARTLLVQSGRLGGDCTFLGCVPSKALIAAAARRESFPAAMKAVHGAVETIASTETDDVFAREGIEVLHGWASFRSAREIDVDGQRLTARRFIVATGSRPAIPPIHGLNRVDYLTNENVFQLERLPESLAVLGGGSIGCELAQAFARLGARVTVIEMLDRLLPREEPDASAVVADVFAAEGIDVRVSAIVSRVHGMNGDGGVRLELRDGQEPVTAERLLVAVGRTGASDSLGLEALGIATDRGFVVVDDYLATQARGIWATGDVTGKVMFTHAAFEMGRVAAANALSAQWRRRRFDLSSIPRVTFTAPEVAQVGLTEAEAAARHGGATVATLPMSEVDRAVTTGETRGFAKLIAGPRPVLRGVGGGRVLGATVVAARGGELIHEPTLAMRTRMFTGRLAQTVHAYPTWSTAIQKAAAQFFMEIDGRRARPAR